jgi:putative transposase
MPAKNALKTYIKNGYYHIYNRGVEKRLIFQDEQDYAVFLSYLKEYLLPKDDKKLREKLLDINIDSKTRAHILGAIRMNNFNGEIELLCFCLMPNHFHLLVKQNSEYAIDKFLSSLCTRYTMYFNKKYKRVGPLFQGVYKAVLIENEAYLLYLSKYIHVQSLKKTGSNRPSSLDFYLGKQNLEWVHKDLILSYFSKTNPGLSYEAFIFSDKEDYWGPVSRLLID